MQDIFLNRFFWFPLLHFSLFSCLGTPVFMLDISWIWIFHFCYPIFNFQRTLVLWQFFFHSILFLALLSSVNTENINDSLFLKSFLLYMWSVLPLYCLVLYDCYAHFRGWLGYLMGPVVGLVVLGLLLTSWVWQEQWAGASGWDNSCAKWRKCCSTCSRVWFCVEKYLIENWGEKWVRGIRLF